MDYHSDDSDSDDSEVAQILGGSNSIPSPAQQQTELPEHIDFPNDDSNSDDFEVAQILGDLGSLPPPAKRQRLNSPAKTSTVTTSAHRQWFREKSTFSSEKTPTLRVSPLTEAPTGTTIHAAEKSGSLEITSTILVTQSTNTPTSLTSKSRAATPRTTSYQRHNPRPSRTKPTSGLPSSSTISTTVSRKSLAPRRSQAAKMAKTRKDGPTLTSIALKRDLNTVYDVWQEYKYGLNGNPSVASLVEKYGIRWLNSPADSALYYKRKRIYDHVINATRDGLSEQNVVNELEALRVSKKWTLGVLQICVPKLTRNVENELISLDESAYRLWRNLTTVAEVWQEYKHGLNGNPSVESIVNQYSARWLACQGDESLYYNRKKIYDYIINAVKNHKSEQNAINDLDNLRIEQGYSLDNLQLNIPPLSSDGQMTGTVPNYKLRRKLQTVPEVWKEYKFGLDGNPSVESLVADYGTRWLKSTAEQTQFYSRKKIYESIKNSIENGISEEAAVEELEQFRRMNNFTVVQLQASMVKSAANSMDQNVPQYNMLRNITTVNELWGEYKYGLYGHSSIESLLNRYGTSWRNNRDKDYYISRNKAYDFIKKAIAGGKSEIDVVNALEELRVAQKWGLKTLQINISSLSFDESTGKLIAAKPVYVLRRKLTTVYEAWQEYKYGLDGNPSVESLVKKYRAKWIKSKSDESLFYQRRRIYDYILNQMTNGKAEANAVKELEDYRAYNGWTLFVLSTNLKALGKGNEQQQQMPLGDAVGTVGIQQPPIYDEEDRPYAEV